jgi:hypothetical protein
MRKNLIAFVGASSCWFALTPLPAAQADEVRVRINLELDPALAMGPRIRTIIPVRRPGPEKRYVAAGGNFDRLVGAVYWRRPYFYWSDGTYDGPTILGREVKIEDAPPIAPRRPAPPSPAERLEQAFAEGDFGAAIDQLTRGEDVVRLPIERWKTAVVALEAAGRTGEAARVFTERLRLAEGEEELGALLELPREELLSPRDQQRANRLTARYAERTEDPRGLVLLASHLWEAGRGNSATRLVEEALEAGLERPLGDRLKRLFALANGAQAR